MGVPSWRMRRRAVFGSLLFAGAVIVYVMVAAYIGGAAYEDVRLFKPERGSGYARGEEGDVPLEEDEHVH